MAKENSITTKTLSLELTPGLLWVHNKVTLTWYFKKMLYYFKPYAFVESISVFRFPLIPFCSLRFIFLMNVDDKFSWSHTLSIFLGLVYVALMVFVMSLWVATGDDSLQEGKPRRASTPLYKRSIRREVRKLRAEGDTNNELQQQLPHSQLLCFKFNCKLWNLSLVFTCL